MKQLKELDFFESLLERSENALIQKAAFLSAKTAARCRCRF
jgi:hypothetical protein